MVYDKLHDSSHTNAQEQDEFYEKVMEEMKALDSYVLHDYIGLCKDHLVDIYTNNYEPMENNKEGDGSESSYYTATSDSSK